jgi:hypothetical protein
MSADNVVNDEKGRARFGRRAVELASRAVPGPPRVENSGMGVLSPAEFKDLKRQLGGFLCSHLGLKRALTRHTEDPLEVVAAI